jgi:hypothetical protein
MVDIWLMAAFLLTWGGVGLCAGIAQRERRRAVAKREE